MGALFGKIKIDPAQLQKIIMLVDRVCVTLDKTSTKMSASADKISASADKIAKVIEAKKMRLD